MIPEEDIQIKYRTHFTARKLLSTYANKCQLNATWLDATWAYRLDGLQQLDAELLDAAMSIGKLDEGLAGGRLWLPDANDREHVAERCQTVTMVTNVHSFDSSGTKSNSKY